MPFDAYRCYLSLKNHFTKDHYDYIKYRGKTRATKQAFYKRKDRFWFEKFARQKNDKEVEEFFVSNFIYSTDPGTMWIGEMIKEGEGRYTDWKKKIQSLSYIFKEEVNVLFEQNSLDLESVPKLISKPLKEKIKCDAQELNFMKRTSRAKLPV